VNGKVYVGRTTRSLETRFREHVSGNNTALLLARAIEKHGLENFEFFTLYRDAVSGGHLNMLEKMYIKAYRSDDPRYGYNLTEGGDGVISHSEIVHLKMRKPHVMSREGSRRIAEAATGNTRASNMSEAKRRKLSRLMKDKRKRWGNKYCSHGFSAKSRRKMRVSRRRYLNSLTAEERSRIYGRAA
jgi:group I intron endonuclease